MGAVQSRSTRSLGVIGRNAVQIAEALKSAGWSEEQALTRYRKGSWECVFDTSHWIEVGTTDNRRIFDVPVPEPQLVQWTVNLIEHLCKTDDRVRALSAARATNDA
jgi:hypothetical protein